MPTPALMAVETPEEAALAGPAVPSCKVPFDAAPARPPSSATKGDWVPVEYRNTCAETRVRLEWATEDGKTIAIGELDPGEIARNRNSRPGNFFRVFDARTQRWIRDVEVLGKGNVDLCACEQ